MYCSLTGCVVGMRQVLGDTVAYLRARRAAGRFGAGDGEGLELASKARVTLTGPLPTGPMLFASGVEADHRAGLLSARALFVLELGNRARWTINSVGQGAAEELRHVPVADLRGHSLATLLRCEDVAQLDSIWPNVEAHGPPSLSPNWILHRMYIKTSTPPPSFDFSGDVTVDDMLDEAGEHVAHLSQYTLVMFRLVPIVAPEGNRGRGRGGALADGGGWERPGPHEVDRVLLIGHVGTRSQMRACRVCGLKTCNPAHRPGNAQRDAGRYPGTAADTNPLALQLRVQRPLPRPQQFESICGPDQCLQVQLALSRARAHPARLLLFATPSPPCARSLSRKSTFPAFLPLPRPRALCHEQCAHSSFNTAHTFLLEYVSFRMLGIGGYKASSVGHTLCLHDYGGRGDAVVGGRWERGCGGGGF